MPTIGLLMFDDVEELDFVGPYEVFTMSNEIAQDRKEPQPQNVLLLGEKPRLVTCHKGMRVEASCTAKIMAALCHVLWNTVRSRPMRRALNSDGVVCAEPLFVTPNPIDADFFTELASDRVCARRQWANSAQRTAFERNGENIFRGNFRFYCENRPTQGAGS